MRNAPRIELVFDNDCPHLTLARENLASALRELGVVEEWIEWDRASASTPHELRRYGSPSILVNGHDVDATAPQRVDAQSCRVYVDPVSNRTSGAPSSRLIADAIQAAIHP